MIASIMRNSDLTLEQATQIVARYIDEARNDYRAQGALLGDTDAGFAAWLFPLAKEVGEQPR
jgi:hypothetical protein